MTARRTAVGLLALVGLATPSTLRASSVVPRPASMEAREGTFALTTRAVIVADERSRAEAEKLAAWLRPATGFGLEVLRPRRARRLCPARRMRGRCRPWIRMRMKRRDRKLGPEAYRMSVRPGGIKIRAGDAAGLFYAGQTLRQLLPPAIYGGAAVAGVDWTVEAVRIDDRPRFSWRGAHLDVARSFMPKEFVMKYVDALAVHKINRLHWHLSDDQGWRVEIRAFPLLTEIGGMRAESAIRALPNGGILNFVASGLGEASGDGIPTAGFYTQDDVREIVAFAAERHVEIVPEIDMPGHVQAAIAAYPALGNATDPVEVSSAVGPHEHIFNVEESTFAFLETVLGELMELFPGEYLHVGGDEVVLTEWERSPAVQARIAALGLEDERALKGWFTNRIAQLVVDTGRRAVGWSEVLQDGLHPDVAIMSWISTDAGVAAAQAGRDVVMTPLQETYFDYVQVLPLPPAEQVLVDDFFGPGSTAAEFFVTDLAEAYGFDPVPEALTEDEAAHVLGAQGMIWTEWIRTPAEVERWAFPRMAALAEVTWSPRQGRDFADFSERLAAHTERLDALGVEYFRGYEQ